MSDITTADLSPDGELSNIRVLKRSTIEGCPNAIFLPDHYPLDGGPCRCFDPTATEMAEWGYGWDQKARHWGDPAAEPAYDYIMNTPPAYDALGEALGLLLRRAKRRGVSVARELAVKPHEAPYVTPRWYSQAHRAMTLAVEDYRRMFGEDPEWLDRPRLADVLALAVEERDRWDSWVLA